ncbi:MAG: TauD/TfdA family dioxygenase [Rhodospirillaceae bacterium]
MAVDVIPTGQACGAQITNIDISKQVSDSDAETIYQAFLEYQVIFFRGQMITPADQRRVCGIFGEVGAYNRPKDRQHPKHASDEIMLISNVVEDGRVIGAHPDGEMMWHTDTPYLATPHKATTLYSVEVPLVGGNTKFSNQYMVYEALSDDLKQTLRGKLAMNCYEFGTTVKTFDKYDRNSVPHHPHPVLRKHPESGKTATYVCPLMTEEIIGMDGDESDKILASIYRLQEDSNFIYEHVWNVGDMIIWDNRCLLHARTDFPKEQRRLLRRVTVSDDHPVMAA